MTTTSSSSTAGSSTSRHRAVAVAVGAGLAVAVALAVSLVVAIGSGHGERAYLEQVKQEWIVAGAHTATVLGQDPQSLTPAGLGWSDEGLLDAGRAVCGGAGVVDLPGRYPTMGVASAEIVHRGAHQHLC